MFKKLTEGYEYLWKSIIRPPREEYKIEEMGINIINC